MNKLYVLALVISAIFFIQILILIFGHLARTLRLRHLKVVYVNKSYLKKSSYLICGLLVILVIAFYFKFYFLFIFTLPFSYLSLEYIKRFNKNVIMTDNTLLYNGVITTPLSSVREVFYEEGSNLEKKYNVPFRGVEKYKNGKYLIFSLASGHNIIVKDFDEEYLDCMQKYFNIKKV